MKFLFFQFAAEQFYDDFFQIVRSFGKCIEIFRQPHKKQSQQKENDPEPVTDQVFGQRGHPSHQQRSEIFHIMIHWIERHDLGDHRTVQFIYGIK